MEARLFRAAILVVALASLGAGYRTRNFIVNAPTEQEAEAIGKQAEKCRLDLAMLWLGKPIPDWSEPCPISATVGPKVPAGGATSFIFDRGQVYGWRMSIQGSLERLLDSVVPHEVTHTVFATHFRQPLPRWADEGACTTVEHTSERMKQQHMLINFLKTGHGIPFSSMFVMKEYPQDVLPLYAQGHSLVSYLLQQGGRRKFVNFVAAGLRDEQWTSATKEHYGYANLAELQNKWLDWVREGSPPLKQQPSPAPVQETAPQLAQAEPAPGRSRPEPNLIYRGQSNDEPVALAGRLVPVAPRERGEVASATRTKRSLPDADQLASLDRQYLPAALAAMPRPFPLESEREPILEWERDGGSSDRTSSATHSSAPVATPAAGDKSIYASRNGQPVAAR